MEPTPTATMPTPWITLVASDLLPYLVADQVAALRTEALAPGQPDPFTEIAPAVIDKVRSYIASNRDNQVDADTAKIPPELKIDVCYLILAPMLGRLGIALTKDQSDALASAQSTLVGLRDKKLVVSAPENPVAPAVQPEQGTGYFGSADKIEL